MLFKTKGIVLRSFKYSETSLIVEVYTREKGLKKYIVSGVRSKKAKVSANLLQLMTILDLVAYDKEGKELNRVKEIKAAHIYQDLPFDIRRSSVGLFITEVAQKVLKQSEQHYELYDFLELIYLYLDQKDAIVNNVHLYFLVHFTQYLGFQPDGQYSKITPFFNLEEGTFVSDQMAKYSLDQRLSQILEQLLDSQLSTIDQLSINRQERNQLLEQLIRYYQLHLENLPNISAHSILKEVLA
ncbi:MAG: DNA repair protein RecO [Bacteroidota bacterium]